MLHGKSTGLRALEYNDLPLLQFWRNNEQMRKFYREYRELSMFDQEQWFKNICCGNKNFCMFGIVAKGELQTPSNEYATKSCDVPSAKDNLIGVCGFTNINWVIRSAELSFYVGWNDIYADIHFAQDAVATLHKYAFETLNMHKVWAEIYEYDNAKKTIFDNMSWKKDAVIRDTAFEDGIYHNSIIYSLLEDEYTSSINNGCLHM